MSLPTCYIAGGSFLTCKLAAGLAPFYEVNPVQVLPRYNLAILDLSTFSRGVPHYRVPALHGVPAASGMGDILQFLSHCRECYDIFVIGDVGEYGDAATPFEVENLWDGYPQSGWPGVLQRFAAATIRESCQAAVWHVILDPLYGPDADFTPRDTLEVSALIARIVAAADKNLRRVMIPGCCQQSRTHLHVDDAVAGLMRLILDKKPLAKCVNIGGKALVRDQDLVNLIRNHVNYSGELVFDNSYPAVMSDSIMSVGPEFEPRVKLVSGIAETVKWYREKLRKDV